MLRFIAVCVAVTFVFIFAIPVLQVAALFGNNNDQTEIAAQIPQETIDPFDVFAENEPSADMLNAIEPAAGATTDQNEDFGSPFFESEHPAFTDHTIEPVMTEPSELDL